MTTTNKSNSTFELRRAVMALCYMEAERRIEGNARYQLPGRDNHVVSTNLSAADERRRQFLWEVAEEEFEVAYRNAEGERGSKLDREALRVYSEAVRDARKGKVSIKDRRLPAYLRKWLARQFERGAAKDDMAMAFCYLTVTDTLEFADNHDAVTILADDVAHEVAAVYEKVGQVYQPQSLDADPEHKDGVGAALRHAAELEQEAEIYDGKLVDGLNLSVTEVEDARGRDAVETEASKVAARVKRAASFGEADASHLATLPTEKILAAVERLEALAKEARQYSRYIKPEVRKDLRETQRRVASIAMRALAGK